MYLNCSPFLRLPLELRQQIYSHLLPRTIQDASHSSSNGSSDSSRIIWVRGNIEILRVCQQICHECLNSIYGTNTFSIRITYAAILFNYTWLLPSGLAPSRPYSLLDHFSQQNLLRIRRFKIDVLQVDSYMGMIKYNCGGRGLVDGLRGQVGRFVDAVSGGTIWKHDGEERGLHSLNIELNDGSGVLNQLRKHPVHARETRRDLVESQVVLDPFKSLRGVRKLSITGAVTPNYVALCERSMTQDDEIIPDTAVNGAQSTTNAAQCRCALNRCLEFQAEGTPGVPQVANIEYIRRPCPLHHSSCDLFSRK